MVSNVLYVQFKKWDQADKDPQIANPQTLKRPRTTSAVGFLRLGVHKKWGSCNYAVDLSFVAAGDWLVRYQQLLPVPW